MGVLKTPKITTTQRLSLTLDVSELVFDTDLNKFYGGDGVTVGGFLVGQGVESAIAPDIINVSATDILNKSVTLSRTPILPQAVTVFIVGGPEQLFGIDYTISGNILSWNGLGFDGFIDDTDTLVVRY